MKKIILGLVAAVLVLAGCAAPPTAIDKYYFYPKPPALPRVQFLASYNGVNDIGGGKSAFDVFVTGTVDARRLVKPYGVAIYEGKIYVCDTVGAVMVFDLEKKTFDNLKGAVEQGKLVLPLNISIDKDGTKYVVDVIRKQVVIFDRDDKYVRAVGIKEKWRPVDAVPFEDFLYVADAENRDIKVFDKQSGELVKQIGANSLDRPTNLAFDQDGKLFVTDAGRFQVVELDRDGHELSAIGKNGVDYGHFARPKGLALDREGRLFVVDASFYNVQVFDKKSGQLLTFFGEGGTAPGKLILPAKVTIDYDNAKYFQQYLAPDFELEYLVIVTSQFADRMVSVFGFGKEKGKKYPNNEEILEEIKERIKRESPKIESVPTQEDPGEKAPPRPETGPNQSAPVKEGAEKTPSDAAPVKN